MPKQTVIYIQYSILTYVKWQVEIAILGTATATMRPDPFLHLPHALQQNEKKRKKKGPRPRSY